MQLVHVLHVHLLSQAHPTMSCIHLVMATLIPVSGIAMELCPHCFHTLVQVDICEQR